MIAVCILIIALGAIALVLFLCEKLRKYSVKATMIKSITSFLFISLAVYTHYVSGQHLFGTFVIVALVFGLLGDIWLDFKYVYRQDEKSFTYGGFIVFGVGHLLYISGMFMEMFKNNPPEGWGYLNIIIPIVIGIAMGGITVLMEKPLKLKYGNYKWIVFLYGCTLFTSVATSIFLSSRQMFQNPGYNMLVVGFALFAISDLILSGTYFGDNKERPFDLISNAVSYFAAQYIIAFSLYFI